MQRSFNPLPPPKRGETGAIRPALSRGTMSFNPLPPPKRGETPAGCPGTSTSHSFNPLPPPKRGETTLQERVNEKSVEFQSTPPAEARGDPSGGRLRSTHDVSIHSPRRSEGRRREKVNVAPVIECFNPLPPPKRGETSPVFCQAQRSRGFNPLPPPKRGETTVTDGGSGYTSRFQSTPPAEARGDDN